jgi:hypothetical protein
MINNLELIKPILNFENSGDFYMLYVLKRKKDQPIKEQDNHRSSKTIKTYCIESIEHLDIIYDEIIQLCETFKARAYINVQKQNHVDMSLHMMIKLAKRIQNGQHNQKALFDSTVRTLNVRDKRWVIDIDNVTEVSPMMKAHIEYQCRPLTEIAYDAVGIPLGYRAGPKIKAVIPTKSGFHLITSKFDVIKFKENYPNIDIQKNNPTVLFIPNSLL